MTDSKTELGGLDVLTIMLSGMGGGRQKNLRELLRRGLDGGIEDEEYQIPSAVKECCFTDGFDSFTESFEEAWLHVIGGGGLESIGHRGDYVVHGELLRQAAILRDEKGISPEDYDSIMEVGRKIYLGRI